MPFKSASVGAVVFPPASMVEEEKRLEWLAGARDTLLKSFEKSIAIIHLPEPNTEEKEDKVHHLHFYAWVGVGQNQNAWLDAIGGALGEFDSKTDLLQISVKPLSNDVGALRYLVHLDQDKIKYKAEDVKASSPGIMAEFKKAISATPKPTIDELLQITSKTALARRVGAENYSKYKLVWADLQDEAQIDNRIEQYRLRQGEIKAKARALLEKAMEALPKGSETTSDIYKYVYGAYCALAYDDED